LNLQQHLIYLLKHLGVGEPYYAKTQPGEELFPFVIRFYLL